jgi:hypothetical protein
MNKALTVVGTALLGVAITAVIFRVATARRIVFGM